MKELVLFQPNSAQCRAALVLLKRTYPKPWEQWLEFRMELLTRWETERGDLVCEYCGRTGLQKVTEGVPPKNQATLDHVKPLAKGGPRWAESNLVVACQPCNQKKGDKY